MGELNVVDTSEVGRGCGGEKHRTPPEFDELCFNKKMLSNLDNIGHTRVICALRGTVMDIVIVIITRKAFCRRMREIRMSSC